VLCLELGSVAGEEQVPFVVGHDKRGDVVILRVDPSRCKHAVGWGVGPDGGFGECRKRIGWVHARVGSDDRLETCLRSTVLPKVTGECLNEASHVGVGGTIVYDVEWCALRVGSEANSGCVIGFVVRDDPASLAALEVANPHVARENGNEASLGGGCGGRAGAGGRRNPATDRGL